jgi:formate hydrogenlyase subunit 6/NADH:ubiquinone oxidoreductase subunit I
LASHENTCFSIGGAGGGFMERRGFGVRISAEDMIRRVRELGRLGLIHVTDNIRDKPSFICNCCGCCCGLLAGITEQRLPHAVSPTRYIIDMDRDLCTGCGLCAAKCQIKALVVVEGKALPDSVNCLGCGACIQFCPKKALRLVKRSRRAKIPRSSTIKFLKIAWEKGKLPAMLIKMLRARLGR